MRLLLIGLAVALAGCSDLVADNTGANAELAAKVAALEGKVAALEGEVPLIRGEVAAQGEIVRFANYRVSVGSEKALNPVFPIQRLVLYESADCSGQGYVDSAHGISVYGARQGVVLVDAQNTPLYIAAGTEAVSIERLSLISTISGECVVGDLTVHVEEAFAVIPNDESVTGMPDTGFAGAFGRVGQFIGSQTGAHQIEILTTTDYIATLDASHPITVGK